MLVSNFNWQTGPLGNYYLLSSSPLINAGSTTANLLGLYHFTVCTNLVSGLQIKETYIMTNFLAVRVWRQTAV